MSNTYTDDDIIESKDDERVRSLIGKKVYSSWSKEMCLYRANHNYIDLQQTLLRIDFENSIAPFVVDSGISSYRVANTTTTEPSSYNVPYIVGVKYICS